MTASPEVKALASRLARLEAAVKQRGDQIAYSSFDDGALREFKTDEAGATQVAQYGQQYDGTSGAATLVSPLPPTPSVPYAVGVAGGINVTIDGTFADDPTTVAPMDFKGFDIAVGPIGFDPIATPPIMTLTSPRGGAVFIALSPGNYEVAVITRTLAGRPSLPSEKDAATAFGIPSQDELDQALADAAAAQAAADAAAGTADAALLSADGKNAITHADYDPIAEPNKAGDTWFTHDPISGVLVAQWRGLGGTAWQQDTISHQLISSVDLGTATVGKLAANFIESGTLSAALQIAGMLIAGMPTGARVVIDDEGIRQYSSAGDIRINLPTDPDVPAQFEGNAIMDSLTVTDFLAVRGVNNEFSKGSVVILSSGTTAPTSAPSIAYGYATYATPRHASGSSFLPTGHNAALDNSEDFYATYAFYGYGLMRGPSGKSYNFPERTDSGGGKRSTYNFDTSTMIAVGGADRIVANGNRCLNNGDAPHYFLTLWDPAPMTNTGSTSPTLKVSLSQTDDNYVWVTKLGRVYSSNNAWANRFALAISQSLVNQFVFRVYSATDAAFTQVGTDLTVASPMASGEAFMGITYGDSVKMGFPGAAQSVWLLHGSVNTYAFTSAGVRIPQFDFPSPSGQAVMCAWGDAASNAFLGFRTTAWQDTTPFTQLTNNHWDTTTTSSKWYASATWYDPDATGATHETAQSARATITMPKRAGLTFTVPAFPARPFPTTTDDVTAARVYIGRGAADPGRANMERAATVNMPTRTGYIGTFTFPAGAAVAPPPATSNFPASAPAKLTSSDGTSWVLQGDGTALLGALEVSPGGSTRLRAITDISLGVVTSATQRIVHFFKLAATGTNYYESREYMYNDGAVSGKAFGIYENDLGVANFIMRPNAQFDIQGVGANVGKGDVAVQGVSVGRGLVPGGHGEFGTSTAVATGTVTDVGGSVTVVMSSARKYKLSLITNLKSTVANDRGTIYIREGSTTLVFNQSPQLVTAGSYYTVDCWCVLDAPTSGTHTYKISLARLSGAGSVNLISSTLLVEDIGAAGT